MKLCDLPLWYLIENFHALYFLSLSLSVHLFGTLRKSEKFGMYRIRLKRL